MSAVLAVEQPLDWGPGRRIVYRTRGHFHGPITRLMSPSDAGQLIKPFVFLDRFDMDPAQARGFGFHPHSGIATITVMLEGRVSYEETSGTKGFIEAGGVEWMKAGGGVWHTGAPVGSARARGFQLWIALPPQLEGSEPHARYLGAADVARIGPARVILGNYGGVASAVPAPANINYLVVELRKGEHWRYQRPPGHRVTWIAPFDGKVATPAIVHGGELAVFEESDGALDFEAREDTRFVLGSAVEHPHDLVLGMYSVHTSQAALERGEAQINRIGRQLNAAGRI